MNQRKSSEKEAVNEEVELGVDINHFANVVSRGEAVKLSPKSKGKVFYEIALHDEDKQLYIHLSGQTESGLFSKEWIKFDDVLALIEAQEGKEFKSAAFRAVFNGGSSNNVSFFSAVMRSLGLIVRSESSVFVHKVGDDYQAKKEEITALNTPVVSKKK